jgi:predicted acetyltransferase
MADVHYSQASEEQWDEFIALAKRSYGHEIQDAELLRDVADKRVAVRAGTVIAGGIGLVVEQFFGGKPVMSGLLSAGCVAPEARGDRLAIQLVAERAEALRAHGAVVSSIWTSSNEYGRQMGWEAACNVYSWQVRADDLRRAFPSGSFRAEVGLSSCAESLREAVAQRFNGAIRRPEWWSDWKRRKSDLTEYEFCDENGRVGGLISLTTARHDVHGMKCEVHDFVADSFDAASSMFAFLSRYNSRSEVISFRRGCLGSGDFFLHNMHRFRVDARAWHPWMIRILDAVRALQQRGWPSHITQALVLEIIDGIDGSGVSERLGLELSDGNAVVTKTTCSPDVVLSRTQFACWYVGGYRSPMAACLSGIDAADQRTMQSFIAMTTGQEPWLSDHF